MFYQKKSYIYSLRKDFISKDGVILLENVSLTLNKNKYILLKGPNGSGKSTLILNKSNNIFNPKIKKFLYYKNFLEKKYINFFLFDKLNLIQMDFFKLSYGFFKYINFYITILFNYPIILFDEPFNGIDQINFKYLLIELKNIKLKSSFNFMVFHNQLKIKQKNVSFLD